MRTLQGNTLLAIALIFSAFFTYLWHKNKKTHTLDIQKIMDYPIPQVLKRYQKSYNIADEVAQEHERELKRYFILIDQFPQEKFLMYSPQIDDLWHTFLLFTKDYNEFCTTMFGYFIHHNPLDEPEILEKTV